MSRMQQAGRRANTYYDSLPADMPVNKAGFIVFGDVTETQGVFRAREQKPERHIVAAWSEGRFKDVKLGYQLPKGSVDGTEAEINGFLEHLRLEYSAADAARVEMAIKEATGQRERSDGTTKQTCAPEHIAAFIAGARESYEETGVDVIGMLGAEHLAGLFRDGVVEGVTSADTWKGPELKIKRVALQPVDDMRSLNRDGSNLRTQLFALQLEDNEIKKLNAKEILKNYGSIAKNGFTVEAPVRHKRNGEDYPCRRDILEWLNTGHMPKRKWNSQEGESADTSAGQGLTDTDTVLQGNEDGSFFRKVVEEVYAEPEFQAHLQHLNLRAPGDNSAEIRSNREFGEFFQYLTKERPDDRQQIKLMAKQMRDCCIKLGLIQGDLDVFKMDTNDIPGLLYQEGAQVIPLKDFFLYTVALCDESVSYDNVMGGNVMFSKDGQPTTDYLQSNSEMISNAERLYHKYAHSQIGMLTSIARPEDVRIHDPVRIAKYHAVKNPYENGQTQSEGGKTDFRDDSDALAMLRRDLQAEMLQQGNPHAAANENHVTGAALDRLFGARAAGDDGRSGGR